MSKQRYEGAAYKPPSKSPEEIGREIAEAAIAEFKECLLAEMEKSAIVRNVETTDVRVKPYDSATEQAYASGELRTASEILTCPHCYDRTFRVRSNYENHLISEHAIKFEAK